MLSNGNWKIHQSTIRAGTTFVTFDSKDCHRKDHPLCFVEYLGKHRLFSDLVKQPVDRNSIRMFDEKHI